MSAQEYNISGMVLGNEDKPLEFTSIILISSDLVFTVSGLTNEKGIFLLKVPKGKYNLISEEFGKEVLLKDIDISSDQNLGVLKIEEAIGLKEVVVTEKEKLIERKVDRLIFHVENSTIAQGGDVLDALNVTPGIIVQNGQISMIGRDNMGVMINGRMINLTGDDLINYLKNLRTETIKNIEVITNPPSKYDAQGNSGLINIITKTVKNDSLSGSVNSSLSQASESIGSGGINLNYQKNRLTITSGLNYSNGSYKPYQRYTLNYPEYFWSEENFKRNVEAFMKYSDEEKKKANKIMAMRYAQVGWGWDKKERACVYKIFMKESRFDHLAKNQQGSSAYGIAQMLGEKSKDPAVQILRAYRYIEHRYGTPCKAWLHHSRGWY